MIISESYARKYFGTKDPINSIVRMKTDKNVVRDYTITGICKDIPDNSHFSFDIVTNGNNERELDWDEFSEYVYVLLKSPESMPQFQKDVQYYLKKYRNDSNKEQLSAQWLADIHLKSELLEEIRRNGDIKTVYSLEIVAFLIVVIVWINYVNMSVARALERSKEIAVRKIHGATRKELLGQLLLESILINVVSIIIAVTLTTAFSPLFGDFIGQAVEC